MEDFYIGGASVKLFLPIFKMNFPEIVDIALPARRRLPQPRLREQTQDLPDASLQNHARPLGHGPDLPAGRQVMFTKYLVVVNDDVDVHHTSEVLFRLCANTDPQRDSIFTKGLADVLDHATSEIAIGTKLGINNLTI